MTYIFSLFVRIYGPFLCGVIIAKQIRNGKIYYHRGDLKHLVGSMICIALAAMIVIMICMMEIKTQ